ncbi:hypothetical protein A2714_04520 [Candidatus Woesebacteria bacterium RIFCSPHIGHO2_01_FULL_38_9]|uniref:Glycosyltransferase 2-like domain-containing protein n=2 Tax=Candidatus Woeseibacteriota TaxID=1752722 RepID=A0A1F7XZY8_9BACT|nr:MAG: hypothetical protein A2714_04520 [Candidatus Woesebacteria bacterium RIFCSPHIGHO2_01_FULL_38_9]OGM58347.1 MAG: hypothetical protein A3A75_04940 [Candidatus Woesebacteria bacterium RIFCSPLOWO2_01_FULL_39_10]
MDLSVIIVNFNTRKLLKNCIASIIKNTRGVSYEIIVVDNASTDGSKTEIKNFSKKAKLLRLISNNKNLGFGAANNQGMKIARGRYILLINSDTKLLENSITRMVQWMDNHSRAGVVSCTLVGPRYSIQLNGGYFPNLARLFLWSAFLDDIPGVALFFGSYHLSSHIPITKIIYKKIHQQDWVSGAVFLLRKRVFDEIGGFDENIFMYGEEVEYCYRIKDKGWQIWYVPISKILHVGTASSKGELVKFAGTSVGKESGLIGEFKALKYFYKKHYSDWKYPILILLLKLASISRYFILGVVAGQKEARRVYAKAFQVA